MAVETRAEFAYVLRGTARIMIMRYEPVHRVWLQAMGQSIEFGHAL